jgi:hypothetical protein
LEGAQLPLYASSGQSTVSPGALPSSHLRNKELYFRPGKILLSITNLLQINWQLDAEHDVKREAWHVASRGAYTAATFCFCLFAKAFCLLNINFCRHDSVYCTTIIHIYCTSFWSYLTKFIEVVMSQAEGDSEAGEKALCWNRARRKCLNRRIKHINVLMRDFHDREERDISSHVVPSSDPTKLVCSCFQLLDDEGHHREQSRFDFSDRNMSN